MGREWQGEHRGEEGSPLNIRGGKGRCNVGIQDVGSSGEERESDLNSIAMTVCGTLGRGEKAKGH